jgi:hypothetical protein
MRLGTLLRLLTILDARAFNNNPTDGEYSTNTIASMISNVAILRAWAGPSASTLVGLFRHAVLQGQHFAGKVQRSADQNPLDARLPLLDAPHRLVDRGAAFSL